MKYIMILIASFFIFGCSNSGKKQTNENTKDTTKMEKTLQKINPREIDENVIKLIGTDWMLIAAGEEKDFNMMTASWGTIGNLWNTPVAVVFVRPQRHTFNYTEENEYFTLTFFEEEYREALQICGTLSGRDVNKVERSGLTPYFTELGNPAFKEAKLVLECKKIYQEFFKEEAFIDKSIVEEQYPQKDFHKIYIAEIVNVWIKK